MRQFRTRQSTYHLDPEVKRVRLVEGGGDERQGETGNAWRYYREAVNQSGHLVIVWGDGQVMVSAPVVEVRDV